MLRIRLELRRGNHMRTEVANWEEFLSRLEELTIQNASGIGYVTPLLFRGQASSEWKLETTLERAGRVRMRLGDYYRTISSMKSEVEAFTTNRWNLPSYPDVMSIFEEYDKGSLELWSG
jgi:hypothetical protein